MKKPKLDFKEVYIVEDWTTKIQKGVGVYFPEVKEFLNSFSNTWLIWIEGENVPEKFYSSKVFTEYDKALCKLQKEKKIYKEYLTESIEKHTLQLKQIEND